MKICSRCKTEKEDDCFRWRYDKRGKGSKSCTYLNNTCRPCDSEIQKKNYFKKKDDPEFRNKWLKKSREYHYAHREECLAKMKARRQTSEYKAKMKAYRETRKEIIKQQEEITKRRYHEKNRDQITDKYLINQLVNQGYGTKEEVSNNNDLIEFERSKILLHRLKLQIYGKAN